MKISGIIEGLRILSKVAPRGLESHINGADHDVVYGVTAELDEAAAEAAIRPKHAYKNHRYRYFRNQTWGRTIALIDSYLRPSDACQSGTPVTALPDVTIFACRLRLDRLKLYSRPEGHGDEDFNHRDPRLSEEDNARLYELGWRIDSGNEVWICFV